MNSKEYKDILNSLPNYTSAQEKNAMLYCMGDEHTAMKVAEILGQSPSNEFEAIAFIFKAREMSVSDLIEFTHICQHKGCENHNLDHISIPNMFWQGKDLHNITIGLFNDMEELEKYELSCGNDNINTMTIPEFNELEEKLLTNNIKIFNPAITLTCRKCGNKTKTSIDYSQIISKFSIKNIYEQYLDISQFTNMTKMDTDSMIPFEREIFISLIQDKEDKKGK